MENFKKLIERCKNSVNLDINTHRDYYESVEDYFDSPFRCDDLEDIEDTVYQEMVRTDTVVALQFYPDTCIGSYIVYHYDVEEAINAACKILNI